jgi:hypothetical protein
MYVIRPVWCRAVGTRPGLVCPCVLLSPSLVPGVTRKAVAGHGVCCVIIVVLVLVIKLTGIAPRRSASTPLQRWLLLWPGDRSSVLHLRPAPPRAHSSHAGRSSEDPSIYLSIYPRPSSRNPKKSGTPLPGPAQKSITMRPVLERQNQPMLLLLRTIYLLFFVFLYTRTKSRFQAYAQDLQISQIELNLWNLLSRPFNFYSDMYALFCYSISWTTHKQSKHFIMRMQLNFVDSPFFFFLIILVNHLQIYFLHLSTCLSTKKNIDTWMVFIVVSINCSVAFCNLINLCCSGYLSLYMIPWRSVQVVI